MSQQDKENVGQELASSMSMVPLTNKQVDMMRREEYMTTSFTQERPAARASTSTTPQMGYGQHGKTVLDDGDGDDGVVQHPPDLWPGCTSTLTPTTLLFPARGRH